MTEKKIYGSKTRTKLELNWSDTGDSRTMQESCGHSRQPSVVKMTAVISVTEKHRSKDEEE